MSLVGPQLAELMRQNRRLPYCLDVSIFAPAWPRGASGLTRGLTEICRARGLEYDEDYVRRRTYRNVRTGRGTWQLRFVDEDHRQAVAEAVDSMPTRVERLRVWDDLP